jgi:hypothetical protein
MTFYPKELFKDNIQNIFVFGSNKAGRHGAGAARFAKEHCGAKYGVGKGIWGNSFAIPTKDAYLNILPLTEIQENVHYFISFAVANPNFTFYITAIGTGLAGYSHLQIAPMFQYAPANCIMPEEWHFEDTGEKANRDVPAAGIPLTTYPPEDIEITLDKDE